MLIHETYQQKCIISYAMNRVVAARYSTAVLQYSQYCSRGGAESLREGRLGS
jgi:hypothetical protein